MSRAMGQNSLTPKGNNNLNFRLARDQVVHFETAANLCASRRQENLLFFQSWQLNALFVCSIFALGGITKHLTRETVSFVSPTPSMFASGNLEVLGETKVTVLLLPFSEILDYCGKKLEGN